MQAPPTTDLLEQAPVLVVLLETGGRVAWVNDWFVRTLGWSRDEVVGRDWTTEFLPERQRDRIGGVLASTVAGESTSGTRNQVLARDGSERTIEWHNRLLGDRVVAIGVDVTVRERVETELARTEHRLAEAQRIARIGSWELDIPAGRLWWSDQIFRMFEIDPERFAASYQAFLEAVHPEDRAAVDQAYRDSLENRQPYEIEHRVVLPGGRLRWVHERCETSWDAAGVPVRSIGTVQDVTERVLAANEHARAEAALRVLLQERERLLREVHHRVKNNLQILSSLLYFQSQRVRDPEALAAFDDGRRRLLAMTLVHEHLFQTDELASIELGRYLGALLDALVRSFQDSDRLRWEVRAENVALPLERALPLGMAVSELVTNSFKYAFPGGREGRLSLDLRLTGEVLRLDLCDDGVGLPEGFDAATTATFGWSLVRNLALQLGGTVAAVSEPGGTRVTLSLPLQVAG